MSQFHFNVTIVCTIPKQMMKKINKSIVVSLLTLFFLPTAYAQDVILPIMPVEKANLTDAATQLAKLTAPIKITDVKTAEKYLEGETLKAVKAVDFKKVKVLVFYWAGSGGDTLSYDILESHPEQINFKMQRGRTKDLRRHSKVFILRENVTYSAPK